MFIVIYKICVAQFPISYALSKQRIQQNDKHGTETKQRPPTSHQSDPFYENKKRRKSLEMKANSLSPQTPEPLYRVTPKQKRKKRETERTKNQEQINKKKERKRCLTRDVMLPCASECCMKDRPKKKLRR
jgi:hypothetical protein